MWPLGRGLDLPGVVLPLAELLLPLSTEEDEAWLEEGGGGELWTGVLSAESTVREEFPVVTDMGAVEELFLDWAAARAALCFLRWTKEEE